LRLQPRSFRYGKGPFLELVYRRNFADAPDVIETTLIEAVAVPDVIVTMLVELALDKVLDRTRKLGGDFFSETLAAPQLTQISEAFSGARPDKGSNSARGLRLI
jgi:hypothetical protein